MKKLSRRWQHSKTKWLLVGIPLGVVFALGLFTHLRPLLPRNLPIVQGSIDALSFSPDGKILAVKSWLTPAIDVPGKASLQSHVYSFDVKSEKQLWHRVVGAWAGYPRFSADSNFISIPTSSNHQSETSLLSSKTGEAGIQLPFTWGSIYSHDGATIFVAQDQQLLRYETATGSIKRIYTAQWSNSPLPNWGLSPDQKYLAGIEKSGNTQSKVTPCVWDTESGKLLSRLPARNWLALRFVPNTDFVILAEMKRSVWSDSELQLWNWRSRRHVKTLASGATNNFLVSGNGEKMFIVRNVYQRKEDVRLPRGGELLCISLPSGEVLWKQKKNTQTQALVRDKDDQLLVSMEYASSVLIWRAESGLLLRAHSKATVAGISSDGKTMATGDNYGTIRLYDTSRFVN